MSRSSNHESRTARPDSNAAQPKQHNTSSSRSLWLPNQHGAWAMVLFPSIAAMIVGGSDWRGIWVTASWALCYCLQFCTTRWLKSNRQQRYLKPMLGYAGILLVFGGIPLLLTTPGLLRWAPAYLMLLMISLLAAKLRRERSIWANAAAIIASCMMPIIICSLSMTQIRDHCSSTGTASTNHLAACSESVRNYQSIISIPDASQGIWSTEFARAWWPEGSAPTIGIVLAAIFSLTQFGSVLFVKTMIRERGKRWYLAVSWVWHIALLMASWQMGTSLICLAATLLARAVALPLIAKTHTIKPLVVGMVELATSLLVLVIGVYAAPGLALNS